MRRCRYEVHRGYGIKISTYEPQDDVGEIIILKCIMYKYSVKM
jgi:hypothetical protein